MVNPIQFERLVIHEYLGKITVHQYFKFNSTVSIRLFFLFIRYQHFYPVCFNNPS